MSFLDKLVAEQVAQPIHPDEFTVQDYLDRMKQAGMKLTYQAAYRRLQKMVTEGVLTARHVYTQSSKICVYREK